MQDRIISMTQLNSDHLFDSGTAVLRTVLARGDFGDVGVWHSQQGTWIRELDVHDQGTSVGEFTNLIVLGEPKAIATKMVTELVFDRGVFETPISMTLAHALNWAHHWFAGAFLSEKAEMINRLEGMRKRSFQRLEYDRFHFSCLLINDLLCEIDQTIKRRDWANFVAAVERLDEQDALRLDPNGIPSDWWASQYEQ